MELLAGLYDLQINTFMIGEVLNNHIAKLLFPVPCDTVAKV
jgi:hypothetical protein